MPFFVFIFHAALFIAEVALKIAEQTAVFFTQSTQANSAPQNSAEPPETVSSSRCVIVS